MKKMKERKQNVSYNHIDSLEIGGFRSPKAHRKRTFCVKNIHSNDSEW